MQSCKNANKVVESQKKLIEAGFCKCRHIQEKIICYHRRLEQPESDPTSDESAKEEQLF